MKNQLHKKIKKIKINLRGPKIIKQPLKLLKKINLKKFGKITTTSLAKTYKNFKKNKKLNEINKINLEKKERIKVIKKEK